MQRAIGIDPVPVKQQVDSHLPLPDVAGTLLLIGMIGQMNNK